MTEGHDAPQDTEAPVATRDVPRRRLWVVTASAVAVVAVIAGVAIAATRSSDRGRGDVAGSRFDRVTTTTSPAEGDTSTTVAEGPMTFGDGHWSLAISGYTGTVGSEGAVTVDGLQTWAGSGQMDVVKGQADGSFQAVGAPSGYVATPETGSCTLDGAYQIAAALSGAATRPDALYTTSYAGMVNCDTMSMPSNVDLGQVSSQIHILSASEDLVVADVDATLPPSVGGLQSILGTRMVATREGCSAAAKLPVLDWKIRSGTPEAPTQVQLDVDESIKGSPALMNRLLDAVNQWNANLGAAGVDIRFTTEVTDPAMPVAHVGIDSETMQAELPDTEDDSGEAMNRPVGGTATAWTQAHGWVDAEGRTYTAADELPAGELYVQEQTVRLRSSGLAPKHGPKPGETWETLATSDPQIVERVFLHELGHLVGLDDQSEDADSVMYKDERSLREHSPTNVGCGDLASLRFLAKRR